MLRLILLPIALAGLWQGTQTPPAQPAQEKNPGDKMVCKRFVETGSLVKGYKECKTKREWDREREQIRAAGPGANSCRDSGSSGGGC